MTLIHFLHRLAFLSSPFVTLGSLPRACMIEMSPSRCNFGHHASSIAILPSRYASLSWMCRISPSSIYSVQVFVSSNIGSVSPESNCACEMTILISWAFSFPYCNWRRRSVMLVWS
jgi:hypothetical protein